MMKTIFLSSVAMLLSVLAAFNVQAADSTSTACLDEYAKLQIAYFNSSGRYTVVSSEAGGLSPYLLLHHNKDNKSYSVWEYLNGENRGYALRDGSGFDFNQVRSVVDELNWHPTLIWDRLLDKNTELKDYVCVFTGRARVAGHKVSLLRLAPQDGLRYGYLVAKDDDTSLPVEISVLEPQGGVVSKLLSLDYQAVANLQFPLKEALFDEVEAATHHSNEAPWLELLLPRVFTLIDSGVMTFGKDRVSYQEYSDGLSSFRVYRAPKTSVLFPALNNGTITIYRKQNALHEYAVVGDIPLRLAEFVLSKLK
ncbi:MAG: MucB/RseB C-terminal domain-containing protein [Proteobacteria bacterium]|uniref:MucB/RseB C-terminal domain-containing protein n=1 Tax=Candidatus Avisuccinivibrio stercorigallinarum TaxID=2840704 RepID=A0A9D9D8H8_9GAMM|nr:MucB/RseB C-terminal domain-containing protein [Candidatus Avisuccinivibrio stercorigallinarum]